MTQVEQVTDPVAEHGEGPVWDDGWGGLRYVDMLVGDVLSLDQSTGEVSRRHVGTVAAALRPRASGGAVIAVERGFALLDPSGELTVLDEAWSDPTVRMNDGGCDPDGRFYCGSMNYDELPGRGAMYRLELDHSVTRIFGDVTVSNGLAWSPDGSLVYYADTPTHRVDVFDYASDTGLTNRRQVVTIPEEAGSPDGLTVDAEGHVWVALWQGGAVRRYAPDGTLEDVIEIPASQVTACTFGGPELSELYVTTSRRGIDTEKEPAAGAVFRATPGVRGLPVLPYHG